MKVITQTTPPEGSLIAPFTTLDAHYVDAFRVRVPEQVTLEQYITAFYTTALFRAERLVLRVAARTPSRDADVSALAAGEAMRFAVWEVEARAPDELLMGDTSGRTKSWLHVTASDLGTDLWFGSVVVPVESRGRLTLGPVFQTLLGAHKLYSRLLLQGAAHRAQASAPR